MGRRPHDGAGERRIVRRLSSLWQGWRSSARSRWRLPTSADFVQRIRYPLRYEAIVRGHAKNYDLDPSLLAAVIYTESRFNAAHTPRQARSA